MLKEPAKQAVREMFSGDLYYDIPRFQRSYVWSVDQVENLLNDISESSDDYFIGSTIIYNDESGYRKFIIDGQQRITTLTILLSKLRDKFYSLGDEDSAHEIDKFIKDRHPRKPRTEQKEYRLVNTGAVSRVKSYFEEKILEFGESRVLNAPSSNYKKELAIAAYGLNSEYIEKYLEEIISGVNDNASKLDELDKFKLKVLNSSLILIVADNFNEGYQIFSTLNARGVNLELEDLIKAHFMQHIGEGAGVDKVSRSWGNIKNNLDECKRNSPRLKEESFFLDAWTVYKNEQKSPEKKVYTKNAFEKSFFKEVNSENAENILKAFELYSKIYYLIFVDVPTDHINIRKELNINAAIDSLRTFNVTQYSGFLLHLLNGYLKDKNRYVDSKTIFYVLEKLTNFHFIFNGVSKDSGNKISLRYKKQFKLLDSSSTPAENGFIARDLINSLAIVQTEFSTFESEFEKIRYFNKSKNLNADNRKLVKFILRWKAKEYLKDHESADFNKFTIEHIIPESENVKKEDEWIGSIGNLFLILDDNLGTLSFAEKKSKLKSESVPYPKFFDRLHDFGESDVLEITREVAHDIYKDLSIRTESLIASSEAEPTVDYDQISPDSVVEKNGKKLDEIFNGIDALSFTRLPANDGWRVEYDNTRIGFCTFSSRSDKYRIYFGGTEKDVTEKKIDVNNIYEELSRAGIEVSIKPSSRYENIILENVDNSFGSKKLKTIDEQFALVARLRKSKQLS